MSAKQDGNRTAANRTRTIRVSGTNHRKGSNNLYQTLKAKVSNLKKNRKGTLVP